MLVGSATLRKLELRTRSKASVIHQGVEDSQARLKLLKAGNSFVTGLERTLVSPRVKITSNPAILDKKFSAPGLASSKKFDDQSANDELQSSDKYRSSLLIRLENSCTDLTSPRSDTHLKGGKQFGRKGLDIDSQLDAIATVRVQSDRAAGKVVAAAQNKFRDVDDPSMHEFLVGCHVLALKEQHRRKLQKQLDEVQAVKDQFMQDRFIKPLGSSKVLSPTFLVKKKHNPKVILNWHATMKTSREIIIQPSDDQNSQRVTTEQTMKVNPTASNTKPGVITKDLIITLPPKSETQPYEEPEEETISPRRQNRVNPTKAPQQNQKARNFSLNKLIKGFPEKEAKAINSKLEVRKIGSNRYQIKDIEQEKIRKIVKGLVRSKKTDDQFIAGLCQD